jgi:hypothetical protein
VSQGEQSELKVWPVAAKKKPAGHCKQVELEVWFEAPEKVPAWHGMMIAASGQ